jgi:hypothetical protein
LAVFRTLVPAPVRAAAAVLFLIDNGDAAVGEGPGVFPRSFWEKKRSSQIHRKIGPSKYKYLL